VIVADEIRELKADGVPIIRPRKARIVGLRADQRHARALHEDLSQRCEGSEG